MSRWTIQWRESSHSLTPCCSFRPISRRSSLMRCRKRRSCSSKSKSFATKAMKKVSFGWPVRSSTIWWNEYARHSPEESAFWSCTACPQEKKRDLCLTQIWISLSPPCRQGSVNFPKMMWFKFSITFGKAVCLRCRVWTTNSGWNISIPMLTPTWCVMLPKPAASPTPFDSANFLWAVLLLFRSRSIIPHWLNLPTLHRVPRKSGWKFSLGWTSSIC